MGYDGMKIPPETGVVGGRRHMRFGLTSSNCLS